MNKLKAWAKHPNFLPGIYLLLITLLILFAGPYFAFAGYTPLRGLGVRLLLSVVIISAYILFRYITYLKAQNNQEALVDAIVGADSIAGDAVDEAVDAEANALKSKFVTAFDVLKQTKGGPTSLIQLPWYMIIGAPGSGKTTLLANSGLNFPLADKLQTKHLDGVGGTKNCDWWITSEAVLLDTAGRYTSQDSFQEVDKSGWMNFLGLIKRYRKKPISGLIVSISMADLLAMNEYELSQHVLQLKRRISDVNQYFNTQFPVYVLITKSDMLAGFSQYYESFSHKEREQAFGITFETSTFETSTFETNQGQQKKTKDLLFEQALNKDVQAEQREQVTKREFTQKFTDLLVSLSRRQWPRMAMERDASKKAAIYSFSDQIASLQHALTDIVVNLGKAEQGIDGEIMPGNIRGMYFTSGTQNGAPIDRMLSRIAQVFGLRHSQYAAWNNDQRSYFIKDVLQKLVFKEADRFGTLVRYQLRKKRLKQAALGLFTLASLFVCTSMYASFKNNVEYISLGSSLVDKWLTQYQKQGPTDSLRQSIPALNTFVNDINGLSAMQNQHFAGLGLNQAHSVTNALNASYERLLETVLLPFIKQEMKQHMQDSAAPVLQYQALKSYLMFATPQRRDNAYLSNYLLNNMNAHGYFSEQEYQQVKSHLSGLVNSDIVLKAPSADSIEVARQSLNAQALDDIYYQQFRSRFINNKGNYQSVAQMAGSNWRTVFTTTLNDIHTLSNLYTPAVFDAVQDQDMLDYVNALNNETWVLGPNTVIDPQTLSQKLMAHYAQDYVQQWQGLMNAIRLRPAGDLASLLTTLPVLTEPSSPIFHLLESVSKATNFSKLQLPDGAASALGSQLNLSVDVTSAQSRFDNDVDSPEFYITSRFSKLHEMMSNEKRLSTQQSLSALLQQINLSLNLQAKSLNTLSNPVSLQALQGFAFVQLAPLDRWLEELLVSINAAQNQITKSQLSNVWQTQIFGQCRAITTTKYPFELRANQDATLADLSSLFSTNGSILGFFNTHLAKLVNTQSTPWTWKNNVQQSYRFAPAVLPFFERSAAAKKALFAKNSAQASAEFVLTPMLLDPKLTQISMNIFGTDLSYQFGRPLSTSVSWPPKNPTRKSDVTFVRRDGSEVVLREDGLFALFKMIDAGQVERLSNNEVQIRFEKNEYEALYKLSTNDGSDPMLLSQLSTFQCLDAL